MATGTFAGVINCMDGRTQEPVNAYLKEKFGVDYVDAITEPGPIKLLAENTDPRVESIKTRCDISLNNHHGVGLAVVSHYDCAGNPVDKDTQLVQLAASLKLLRSWYPTTPLYGLWVDEQWQVTEISADVPA
jgi:hypothetical protein